ncbi:MAG: hypothetical protein E7054_10575 [Lentisphaerae bacterium]|nr:hypothetical protein [Lentisphaerota bacterium]
MRGKVAFTFVLLVVIIAAIVIGVSYSFNNVQGFRELFFASTPETLGSVGPEAEETLAKRSEFTARVSMWIFVCITILQFIAVWIGYAVVSNIKAGKEEPEFKLKNLENAEVFFDIPLYFGLFGTVSAFLVMTFSPQSSRLIAYSSTLIGIIFSLILRVSFQYPLRRKLMREQYNAQKGADK